MADWLLPSALKRGAEATGGGEKAEQKKGKTDQSDDSRANAKLLRQLEARVRTLESGAGLIVYGSNDDDNITMLKNTYQEYQKKVEGKANTHGLGPPGLHSLAALLSVFSGWLEKQGKEQ